MLFRSREISEHPHKGLKFKRWAIASVEKNVKELDVSCIAGRKIKLGNTLGNNLTVSDKHT